MLIHLLRLNLEKGAFEARDGYSKPLSYLQSCTLNILPPLGPGEADEEQMRRRLIENLFRVADSERMYKDGEIGKT